MSTPSWSGYAHVAIAAGLLILSAVVYALSRRGWPYTVAIAFILACHPAWTIEPGHDHDGNKRHDCTFASGLAAFFVLGHATWVGWALLRRSPTGSDVEDNSDGLHIRRN